MSLEPPPAPLRPLGSAHLSCASLFAVCTRIMYFRVMVSVNYAQAREYVTRGNNPRDEQKNTIFFCDENRHIRIQLK